MFTMVYHGKGQISWSITRSHIYHVLSRDKYIHHVLSREACDNHALSRGRIFTTCYREEVYLSRCITRYDKLEDVFTTYYHEE
jgi:hypothetical protein